tara:strand:- start:5373 stop:5822 length:450 start_codon:yes stop_codon:yes gene_type:complete
VLLAALIVPMVGVAKVDRCDAVGFTQCVAREEWNRKVVRILSRAPAGGDGGAVVRVEFLVGEVAGTVKTLAPEQVEQLLRLDTLEQARDVVSKLASLRALEGGAEGLVGRLLVESGAILSDAAWQSLQAEAAHRLAEEAEMTRVGIFFA